MTQPRALPRLLVAVPLALVAGFVAMVATSLIGWSLDVHASALDRVMADKWLLTISAVTGGATGALLAWAFTNRTFILLGGTLLGMMPAILKASAQFTSSY